MKKSDFWEYNWIPIFKRIPPEDPERWVLVWNYIEKRPFLMQSNLARYAAIDILKKEKVSWDRVYSDWCFISKKKKKVKNEQKRRRSRSD